MIIRGHPDCDSYAFLNADIPHLGVRGESSRQEVQGMQRAIVLASHLIALPRHMLSPGVPASFVTCNL